MNKKTYNVVEYSIGSKEDQERIIFKNKEDMLQAKQDISDSKDIQLLITDKNGTKLIIDVPNRMIGQRYYKGEIMLAAIAEKSEK